MFAESSATIVGPPKRRAPAIHSSLFTPSPVRAPKVSSDGRICTVTLLRVHASTTSSLNRLPLLRPRSRGFQLFGLCARPTNVQVNSNASHHGRRIHSLLGSVTVNFNHAFISQGEAGVGDQTSLTPPPRLSLHVCSPCCTPTGVKVIFGLLPPGILKKNISTG